MVFKNIEAIAHDSLEQLLYYNYNIIYYFLYVIGLNPAACFKYKPLFLSLS